MIETQSSLSTTSAAGRAVYRAGTFNDALLQPAAPRADAAGGADAGAQKHCLPNACLASLLDELDTGIVVCDALGHALLVNEAARREMADGGVLHLDADASVGVANGTGLLALRRAVHGAASEGRHQLLPLQAGGRVLLVGVQPLRGTSAHQPCAVLLLGRRKLCADLAVHRLGGLYELTDAEKAVLASLLAGTRVGALARLRGVAVSTVRTQVAALRAKFGVKRVDDLTRLAAELPPMVSALRSPLGRLMGAAGTGGPLA